MDFDLPKHPLDEETDVPGGIAWTPSSPYVKEMRKWEQYPSEWTVKSKPGNPYEYRPYPRMIYKAHQMPNGQWACMMQEPDPYHYARPEEYERAVLAKQRFDKTCQKIVHDESQERIALGQGWAEDPNKAMARHEQREQEAGNAAAEVAYAVKRMSDKAQREVAAADASTHEHIVDIAPKKRGRGRPKGKTSRGEVAEE